MKALVLALFFILPAVLNAKPKAWVEIIQNYYRREGISRTAKTITRCLNSVKRVSRMTRIFPSSDLMERKKRLLGWASRESALNPDYNQINIPGKWYVFAPRGVKELSVDVGWIGLNESNVRWAEMAAYCLQQHKPWPEWLKSIISSKTRQLMRETITIPKSLRLYYVDMRDIRQVKAEIRIGLKAEMPPHKVTNAELDSLLIYRVLVEFDRWQRGWPWKNWDEELMSLLPNN